jgi:hypothetical protein
MNPESTKTIFTCYAVVLVAGLLLAIPGIIWGRKKKVVIYHGKLDLVLSGITLPVAVISLADLSFEDWFSWTIKIAGVILFSCSVWMSYAANQNVGKTIVAMATKFVLVGLIASCALLALEGLFGGIKAQRKRDYEKAAAKYITGALSAFGVYHLHKLIATFVRENPLHQHNHGIQI